MDVRCDRCETEYELDDAIVTDAGASVQCTTCGHTFIVTKRPSSPLHHMGLTPPRGVAGATTSEPEVPQWTLSTDDGKVHRFRDLNTLQKWIVERKVSRTERISRGGGPWLALEDVVELTPFFKVVDEADRARASTGIPGGMPTAPTFTAPAGGWSAGSATSPASGPLRGGSEFGRGAGTPPPVPADARRPIAEDGRRPISEDGPTVPNRRLPAELTAAMGLETESAPAPVPALAARPLPGMRDSQPTMRNTPPQRTPQEKTTQTTQTTQTTASNPSASAAAAPAGTRSSSPRPAVAAAAALVANEGIRRAGAAAPRSPMGTELMFGQKITAETRPLDEDSFSPSKGPRNAAAAAMVVLLLAAAGGGYWWWQGHQGARPGATEAGNQRGAQSGSTAVLGQRPTGEPGADDDRDKASAATTQHPRAAEPAATAGAPPAGAPVVANAAPATAAAPGATAPRSAPAGDAGEQKYGRPAVGAARAASATPPAGASRGTAPASSSYEHLVAEADRLLERGKTAKADKLYVQALAARPDGVAALTGSAYVLLDRQRHFKAIETFRRALAIQPTFGPALFGIAESYRARGDTAQALGAYRQYLAIAPSGSDAPAARRQIKELESAAGAATSTDEAAARRASPENSPAEQDTN